MGLSRQINTICRSQTTGVKVTDGGESSESGGGGFSFDPLLEFRGDRYHQSDQKISKIDHLTLQMAPEGCVRLRLVRESRFNPSDLDTTGLRCLTWALFDLGGLYRRLFRPLVAARRACRRAQRFFSLLPPFLSGLSQPFIAPVTEFRLNVGHWWGSNLKKQR